MHDTQFGITFTIGHDYNKDTLKPKPLPSDSPLKKSLYDIYFI